MIWKKVGFYEDSFDAYLDPNDRWNGFVKPRFRKDDVTLISDELTRIDENERLEYDEGRDCFTFVSHGDEYESYFGEDIEGMHLYPIGAGSWVWLEED